MKKAKGLRKRWYMLRDLLGIPSKKYNYKNNYIKDNDNFVLDEIKLNHQLEKLDGYKLYKSKEQSSYLNKEENENTI